MEKQHYNLLYYVFKYLIINYLYMLNKMLFVVLLISDGLIRMSVGIEDIADILADLEQAVDCETTNIVTEEKIPIIDNMITYDFTTSANPSTGINKQKIVTPGIWAMFAGDALQEGDINGNDKILCSVNNGEFRGVPR